LDERALLDHLEALAHNLGVRVRYERLESESAFPAGGFCRVKEKQYIIINAAASPAEKARTLARALNRFDLGGIYIKPAIRDYMEGLAQER
jgi:hypothetical protein